MKIVKFILSFIVVTFLTGCSSPTEKINEVLHAKDRAFIDSDLDYMYNESKSCFFIIEGPNPLADESLRKAAFDYAEAAGMAQYSNDMAYSVRNTYDDNFKLAPNWFEEEKRFKQQAEAYEADAERLKDILKCLIKSNKYTTSEGGIWVYHKLTYKEYLYKCFSDPYEKESIYLYSDNGEEELWSEGTLFSEQQLSEILKMTGTKFTVQRCNDYKFN